MIFRFTTANTHQEIRPFFYQFNKLEAGFDFLNRVVSEGDTLLSVFVIDNGHQTSLPVAAFDGSPFLANLKQLELEWTDLLSRPFQADVRAHLETNNGWYKEKLRYYEQHIISLELLIADTVSHCEQLNNSILINDDVVVTRYNSILKRYRAQLSQAYLVRDSILTRLYNSQLDH